MNTLDSGPKDGDFVREIDRINAGVMRGSIHMTDAMSLAQGLKLTGNAMRQPAALRTMHGDKPDLLKPTAPPAKPVTTTARPVTNSARATANVPITKAHGATIFEQMKAAEKDNPTVPDPSKLLRNIGIFFAIVIGSIVLQNFTGIPAIAVVIGVVVLWIRFTKKSA
jgi:hypothetical protein